MKIKPEATPVLNERQRAFARAYFAGPTQGNGSASARLVGYTGSDHVVETTASRLLRHAGVEAELDRLRSRAESKTVADAASTLLMLSQMQRGEVLAPLAVKNDGTIVYGPAKHGDRTRAAELRAKMLGELRESVDVNTTVSGPGGGPIQVQHIPPAIARAELLAMMTAKLGAEAAEIVVRQLLGEPEPVMVLEAPKEPT